MKKIFTFFLLFIGLILVTGCTKKYVVTFESNDAVVETVEIVDGEKVTEVTLSSIADQTFIGWYLNDEEFDFNTPITSDITLIAKWKTNQFTVTFKDEDGTVLKEETLDVHSTITAPSDPTKGSDDNYIYTFAGWDKEFDEITEDIVITAVYTKTLIKYNVTLFDEDGKQISEIPVEKGKSTTLVTLTKDDDSKFSYTFIGWYTESGEKVTNTTVINQDMKLYPKFNCTPLSYDTTNKTVSILGDSISTFYNASSSINSYYSGENQFYYPTYSSTVKTAESTWWSLLINQMNAKLGVNNSLSGSSCYNNGSSSGLSGMDANRINTLDDNGTPDIIITFLGTNDNVNGFTTVQFENAYNSMLQKINTTYPNAYVFCINLGYSAYTQYYYTEEDRVAYNNIIEKVANNNFASVIDLASIQTSSTYTTLLGDNLHLNANGMKALASKAFVDINSFLNKGRELYLIGYSTDEDTTLSDDEIIVYYENEEVTLPTAIKTGYDFLGWHLEEDLSDEAITSTKNLEGDLVLYPHFEATLGAGEYRVFFETNGGVLSYSDKAVLLADFLSEYSAFYTMLSGTETVFTSLADYGCSLVNGSISWKFKYSNPDDSKKEQYGNYAIFGFFKTYNNKWGWLFNYIHDNAVQNTANISYVDDKWPEPFVMEIYAFFNDIELSWSDVHTTANYANKETLAANYLDYATYTKIVSSGTTTLPTPTKEGATFAGWYLSSDFSGTAVTEITNTCTVYAKWE